MPSHHSFNIKHRIVKRKTSSNATSNFKSLLANRKKLMKVSKTAAVQCSTTEEEFHNLDQVSTTAATKKRKNYLIIQDDDEEHNHNALFKSLQLLATVVTATGKPIANDSSLAPTTPTILCPTDLQSTPIMANSSNNPSLLTPIIACPTDLQSTLIANSSNNPTLLTPIIACPTDLQSTPIMANSSNNPTLLTPIIACPTDLQSTPIIDNSSSNQTLLTPIIACPTDLQSTPIIANSTPIITCPTDLQSTPILSGQINQLHDVDNDIHTSDQQLFLNGIKDMLMMMQELITNSINEVVPARLYSSMTILNELGELESKVLKPSYTRIEQEGMIKALAEAERNMLFALMFLEQYDNNR
jgi:hypothetical protein